MLQKYNNSNRIKTKATKKLQKLMTLINFVYLMHKKTMSIQETAFYNLVTTPQNLLML